MKNHPWAITSLSAIAGMFLIFGIQNFDEGYTIEACVCFSLYIALYLTAVSIRDKLINKE